MVKVLVVRVGKGLGREVYACVWEGGGGWGYKGLII